MSKKTLITGLILYIIAGCCIYFGISQEVFKGNVFQKIVFWSLYSLTVIAWIEVLISIMSCLEWKKELKENIKEDTKNVDNKR